MLSFVQSAEFNIVFMFSPANLAFYVEADLQVCAVNRPVSILASFIVFLIHLAIVSLDTGLNGFVVEKKVLDLRILLILYLDGLISFLLDITLDIQDML